MEEEKARLDNHKNNFIVLYVILTLIGGYILWSATHTRNKKESFSDSAKQINNYHITKNYGLGFFDLALLPLTIHGCSRPDRPDAIQELTTNEVVDAKQVVNAVASDDKP